MEKFGAVLFHDGHPVPELVGKDAPVIAKAAGFDIPKDTKVMGLKIDAVGKAECAEQGDHGSHCGAEGV